MKVLILVEDYPSKKSHAMMYVHVRNKYYVNNQINVTVLNFSAEENYKHEGINVITLNEYKKQEENYDVLICHAANIKHHYMFINKYEKHFSKIIFFYHGHEILKVKEIYPKDYEWLKTKSINSNIRNIYDTVKLFLWRKKLKKILYKSHLIFVSNWLYHKFLYYVHINPKYLENHVSIINNSVGNIFEVKNYNKNSNKKYDFITIRGNAIDKSKYGIDIVVELAKLNPKYNFLIIGKGKYFKYNEQPKNVKFVEKILTHEEMLKYLDESKFALLPTKQDTQGVMTCEVATYGIPTITSNIEVCKEIFKNFDNVELIDNDNLETVNLEKIIKNLNSKNLDIKNKTYFANNTIKKEVDLIKKIIFNRGII